MHTGNSGEGTAKLLEPGDMFGDYTVEKLLGQGGMGAVYLMRTSDGMLYAVKVMDAELAEKNQNFLKRFLYEADFAVRVRHPNLIAVHRVGKDEKSGLCFLVMDYLPGGSLADRLEKCKRLSVEESVSIVVQIAAALEVAHRNGVIHRDIKPGNIMFDIDGTPKLADLGVAKFSNGAHKTTMTTTGMIIGTPAYMAPEQMLNSHKVDSRADIYSLGVVFYEMLAGKRPNEDSTAVELLAKAIKGDTLPDVRSMRPEVSAALAYVLSLMCAPKPENRPSTPDAVVELCQRAVNGTLDVPRERVAPQVPRSQGGKSLRGSFVVVAAILAAGALGWGTVKVAQRFMPADGQQVRVVTNTVDHVVHVTNTIVTAETVANQRKRHDKKTRLDVRKSTPIRNGKKDDRTSSGKSLTINREGASRGSVTRKGGADAPYRTQGTHPATRRVAYNDISSSGGAWTSTIGEGGVQPGMSGRGDVSSFARTLVGIAEPIVGSSLTEDDARVVWDELEASFHRSDYVLISRAALKQMMTEIGLTTSSDLLNMNSSQKAKLGQIEGIKYLIVPSLRKLGTRITLTLKTVESSTGEVDQGRSATLKATSLDEISDKLEVTLADMLRNDKNGTTVAKSSKKCALLTPVIKMAQAPTYLQGDFNTWMQSALLSKGIQLANLADVSRFQKAGLTEMTDRDYAVLGRELRVACLIQFEITDFAIVDVPWASPETGASGHSYSGRFRARMKVVDAKDGSLVDACPVIYDSFLGKTVNGMPPPPVESWAEQMIMKPVMEQIAPRLEQALKKLKR